jgi:hypothetical protein
MPGIVNLIIHLPLQLSPVGFGKALMKAGFEIAPHLETA